MIGLGYTVVICGIFCLFCFLMWVCRFEAFMEGGGMAIEGGVRWGVGYVFSLSGVFRVITR